MRASIPSISIALFLLPICSLSAQTDPNPAATSRPSEQRGGETSDPESGQEQPRVDIRYTLPIDEKFVGAEGLENPKSQAEVDAIWAAVLSKLGYEAFNKVETIGFSRGSTHWRNGKQFSYDSYFTRAFTAPPMRARAEETSNFDEADRLIPFAAIVNDDDRFEVRKREVLASELHEKDATLQISHELMMGLLPFYLARAGAKPTFAGRSTLSSHQPAKLDADQGCIEFEPVTREFDVLEIAVPEPYSLVLGPSARLYVDAGGSLRMFSSFNRRRPAFYGERMRLFFEYVDQTEVGGMLLPTRIDVYLDFDAYRFETIELWDWQINPELPPKLLRRP